MCLGKTATPVASARLAKRIQRSCLRGAKQLGCQGARCRLQRSYFVQSPLRKIYLFSLKAVWEHIFPLKVTTWRLLRPWEAAAAGNRARALILLAHRGPEESFHWVPRGDPGVSCHTSVDSCMRRWRRCTRGSTVQTLLNRVYRIWRLASRRRDPRASKGSRRLQTTAIVQARATVPADSERVRHYQFKPRK
jgi:hypothetical protein